MVYFKYEEVIEIEMSFVKCPQTIPNKEWEIQFCTFAETIREDNFQCLHIANLSLICCDTRDNFATYSHLHIHKVLNWIWVKVSAASNSARNYHNPYSWSLLCCCGLDLGTTGGDSWETTTGDNWETTSETTIGRQQQEETTSRNKEDGNNSLWWRQLVEQVYRTRQHFVCSAKTNTAV